MREAGAYDILRTIDAPDEAANAVIDGYRLINQNVIAEGQLCSSYVTEMIACTKFFKEAQPKPCEPTSS